MNKLIKIISCLPSDKGNYHEMYYEDDGKPFKKNLFPPLDKVAIDNVGKQMTATFEKKDDKYWNITALEDPSAMPAAAASGNGGGGSRSTSTDASIFAQTMAKLTSDRWGGGELKDTDTEVLMLRSAIRRAFITIGITIPIKDKDGDNPVFASKKLLRDVWDKLGEEAYNTWLASVFGDPTKEDAMNKLKEVS